MITETVKISNRSGLHARPAMMIVQKAGEFNCDITIAKEDVKVDPVVEVSNFESYEDDGQLVINIKEGKDIYVEFVID